MGLRKCEGYTIMNVIDSVFCGLKDDSQMEVPVASSILSGDLMTTANHQTCRSALWLIFPTIMDLRFFLGRVVKRGFPFHRSQHHGTSSEDGSQTVIQHVRERCYRCVCVGLRRFGKRKGSLCGVQLLFISEKKKFATGSCTPRLLE
jgi:hypothetical protein